MPSQPSKTLEVVPNPHPDRDYEVSLEIPEFTYLCPRTGPPDFASIRARYVPDQRLLELKATTTSDWSYREEGAIHRYVKDPGMEGLEDGAYPGCNELVGYVTLRWGR